MRDFKTNYRGHQVEVTVIREFRPFYIADVYLYEYEVKVDGKQFDSIKCLFGEKTDVEHAAAMFGNSCNFYDREKLALELCEEVNSYTLSSDNTIGINYAVSEFISVIYDINLDIMDVFNTEFEAEVLLDAIPLIYDNECLFPHTHYLYRAKRSYRKHDDNYNELFDLILDMCNDETTLLALR